MQTRAAPSVISGEVARFETLGDAWWDADGPMAPLHRLGPVRVGWARDLIVAHFRRGDAGAPLAGLDLLDLGSGAGLFAEPMARLGANVLGVDPSASAVETARRHAEDTGAAAVYRVATVEDVVAEPRRFDVVTAMEVVEHVASPARFVAAAATLIKPGGLFLASTLNRTLRSFALAIIGAEYVLRWLPPGTHRWEQFVAPGELFAAARAGGLRPLKASGMVYDPLRARWRLSADLSVNYLFAARKRTA